MSKGSLYKLFGTDKDIETEGIWINYADTEARFKIARIGGANSAYSRYLTAKLKPHKHQMDTGTLPDDKAEAIMLDAFIYGVLKDWDGVCDESGKVLEFSEENARKLFKALPALYKDLTVLAADFNQFKKQEDEDIAKNSELPCDGI